MVPILWVNLLIYLIVHGADLSMQEMGENVAFCMGGNITFYRNVDFFRRRDLLSDVIEACNSLSQDMASHPQYGAKYRHLRNRVHYWELMVAVPVVVVGFLVSIPPMAASLITGELFLFPVAAVNPTPYGWSFMLEWLFQTSVVGSSAIYYQFYEIILVTIYVQLIFAFKMINEEFERLRPTDCAFDEEEEYQKLVNCFKRLQNLEKYRDVDLSNR